MKGVYPFERTELGGLLDAAGRGRNGARNRALIMLGLNTGYRITALLSLQRRDVLADGAVVDLLTIAARKHKRHKSQSGKPLTPPVRAALREWLEVMDSRGWAQPWQPLFRSDAGPLPISRATAWRIVHGAARKSGITRPAGCHSLRKTFGNLLLAELQKAGGADAAFALQDVSAELGHSSLQTTEHYLMLRRKRIENAINSAFSILSPAKEV